MYLLCLCRILIKTICFILETMYSASTITRRTTGEGMSFSIIITFIPRTLLQGRGVSVDVQCLPQSKFRKLRVAILPPCGYVGICRELGKTFAGNNKKPNIEPRKHEAVLTKIG